MQRWPFTHPLSACLLSCNLVAASRKTIVGRQSHTNCTCEAASCMQISVNFIHVACNWRPRGYNLHATDGHSGTNYMRLAASCMQILHALAAI
jgi:hypothetical protein